MCGALLADAGATVGEEARSLSWKSKIVNNDDDPLIGGGKPSDITDSMVPENTSVVISLSYKWPGLGIIDWWVAEMTKIKF